MAETIELADVLDDDLCISSINAGASGTIDLAKNGDQILYLDQVGANIALAISQVTNPLAGFFERSIIGSATYNVGWDTQFISKCNNAGITLPDLGNGAGKRNNIAFVWNRAEGSSTDVSERIIAISNHIGKASSIPIYTAPVIVAARIGDESMDTLTLVFDKATVITGLTGIQLTALFGGALTAVSIISGSGTTTIKILLNRSINDSDSVMLSINAINNISSLAGNIPFAGVSKTVNTSTAPIYQSSTIGNINTVSISIKFNRTVNIDNINGLSVTSNSVDDLHLVGIASGSGTDTVVLSLNRDVLITESVMVSIINTNTITATLTGIKALSIADSLVYNIAKNLVLTDVNIGEISQDKLTLKFADNVSILNTDGITITANPAITVTSIDSNTADSTIILNLSRSLVGSETASINITTSNTITSAFNGSQFAGTANRSAVHTIMAANFISSPAPMTASISSPGGSIIYSNGCSMVATSTDVTSYLFISYSLSAFGLSGKHVRIRIKDLNVLSGSFLIRVYTGSTISVVETVSVGSNEHILDIPVYPSVNADNMLIGDGGALANVFNISMSKVYIDVI